MDRLQTLEMFVAVASEGGFAAAARKLGSSPPALPEHLLFEPSRAGLPAVRLFIAAIKQRMRMAGLV